MVISVGSAVCLGVGAFFLGGFFGLMISSLCISARSYSDDLGGHNDK